MPNRGFGIVLGLVLAVPASAAPLFTPVPVPEHIYAGGWEHFVGGGLAVFDCNGDHLPELFAAGGANPASLFINRSTTGGEVSFERAKPDELALTGVTGAYPIDIDSDTIMDLVVLRVGENKVLKGQGDCAFTTYDGVDVAQSGDWTTAFSATWESAQSLPTLAFGNYVDRNDPKGPFEACSDHALYRPEGDSYGVAEVLAPGFCTLSMLFSDWGRNGRADLRVSNDRHYYVNGGAEQLWAMEQTPRLYGEADGWKNYKLWGMGIASRDISGDGLPEIYLSSMGDQRLQSLKADADGPSYEDASFNRGTTAHRPFTGDDGRPSTGWHVAFGDVTNDGRDDVFIAKGNVEQMPGSAMKDPNNLLIQQPDGTFVEAGAEAQIASMVRSRGAALVDLNQDGLLDLAVVNRRAPLEVYRNISGDTGNWISVELQQSAPNTHAIGAWIEVEAGDKNWARELTIGGGHVGGVAGPEHFGLGDVEEARLRVIWPDGVSSDWSDVAVNQSVQVTRSAGALEIIGY